MNKVQTLGNQANKKNKAENHKRMSLNGMKRALLIKAKRMSQWEEKVH